MNQNQKRCKKKNQKCMKCNVISIKTKNFKAKKLNIKYRLFMFYV